MGGSPDDRVTGFGPLMDEVRLTSVGIDVGSSTSHLIISEITLRRRGEVLSTRFEVVERAVLYQSDIWLTPYVDGRNLIAAAALREKIDTAYQQAGMDESAVDTGAVILTGTALLRENALPVVEQLARNSGKFVCATAGHSYEAVLAAHGSGAVEMSEARQGQVLSVDIGGGTTKLSLVESGSVVDTLAIAAGARLVAVDADDRVTRLEDEAAFFSEVLDGRLAVGSICTAEDRAALGTAMADEILRVVELAAAGGVDSSLGLTWLAGGLPRLEHGIPVVFSGGVSEFMAKDRSARDVGDCGQFMAQRILSRRDELPGPMVVRPGGIRATVVGAGQYTVQVSGNTIFITDESTLPLRNIPVAVVNLPPGDVDEPNVGDAIRRAVDLRDLNHNESPIAYFVSWDGPPSYVNLRAIASGLLNAHTSSPRRDNQLVVATDADIARSVGGILHSELGLNAECVVVDALTLSSLDFIDIGERSSASNTVPVVIKSLLVAGD